MSPTKSETLPNASPDPRVDDAQVGDLAARGFARFKIARSKGHAFDIWLRPPLVEGRSSWRTAVLSRGGIAYATSYVADGMLRASIPLTDPAGYLLFRCGTDRDTPRADRDFECKFGSF